MNELSESELQALEMMEPHEFHRVLLQIVAGGMTAWRGESAQPRNRVVPAKVPHSTPLPAAAGQQDLEVAEVLV